MKLMLCRFCGVEFSARAVTVTVCRSALCRRKFKDEQQAVHNARRLHKMRSDPEYRNRRNQLKMFNVNLLLLDPEYRKKQNIRNAEWRRKRRRDPEYRKRLAEQSNSWQKANRSKRNERNRIKLQNDPNFREKIRLKTLKHHRRRAAIVAAVKELGLINMGDVKC